MKDIDKQITWTRRRYDAASHLIEEVITKMLEYSYDNSSQLTFFIDFKTL